MPLWISTKTFTHSEGLTCCFRQWKSTNRSNKLHGFALSFKLVFECHKLDEPDWVIDFLSMEHIRDWLKSQFDHTTLVAEDDPDIELFRSLNDSQLIDLRVLSGVGCEKFAEHVFRYVMRWLIETSQITRVTIRSVECVEHEGNSALFVE